MKTQIAKEAKKSSDQLTYYKETKVVCACGNKFVVGSTMPEIRTEICSNCHPFYTGKQNLIDTAGRVERFAKIMAKHEVSAAKVKSRARAKAVKNSGKDSPPKPLDNAAKLKKIKKDLDAK